MNNKPKGSYVNDWLKRETQDKQMALGYYRQ